MDHIPPETIYARPLPHPRPSVPACRRCHNVQTSRDDQHFRDTVLNYFRVTGLPQAQQQLAAMLSGLKDPQQQKYRAAMTRRLGKAELRTPSGLYLGRRTTYKMDVPRLDRTGRRYVRGLHSYALGTRLPEDWSVLCMVKPDFLHAYVAHVGLLFNGRPRVVVQSEVFWYSWLQLDDGRSVWLLVFFDAYPIIGVLYPPGAAPADVASRRDGVASIILL